MAGPRDLHEDAAAEVIAPQIKPVWIVRLDIETDPVYAWTGRGQFVASDTGDDALDGHTYDGLGNIGEISSIKEDNNGSDTVTLTLPGVELDQELLDQIVNDARKWQGRRAWLWLAFLNETYGVVANPIRVKSAVMDQMKLNDDGGTGTIVVTLESHQAHISRQTRTRYSRQRDIDPEDASQDYIHDLANKQPPVGEKTPTTGRGLILFPMRGWWLLPK